MEHLSKNNVTREPSPCHTSPCHMMILYRDKQIIEYEDSGRWVECVKYLFKLWEENQNNEALFLRLSTTCWYSLTLDGVELSLIGFEREKIIKILHICYEFFQLTFSENDTCQWMFGYMMEVRPDLFFDCGLEYNSIEEKGKLLIEKSTLQGNELAKLLDDKKRRLSVLQKQKASTKKHIAECFDDVAEVDKYFSEILTMSM